MEVEEEAPQLRRQPNMVIAQRILDLRAKALKDSQLIKLSMSKEIQSRLGQVT